MKFIATDVDDSATKMAQKLEESIANHGRAMDPYFYRSHLVYQRELDQLIFRSWLYAGTFPRSRTPATICCSRSARIHSLSCATTMARCAA
ncbi:hypothetical protein [Halioglobus japonicus]|uniref:hypothetical protein n=1 Tax=Halioglobus japonicus TaxID=930805 RepID=UPI001F0B38E1|nr:hypothetical protein [Halioglobus japonicus]